MRSFNRWPKYRLDRILSYRKRRRAGTHDYQDVSFRFVSAPVSIAGERRIAARAFIGPGVEVGHVGAGSIVTRSVDAETIVAGNPAKLVGRRTPEIPAGVPK